MKLVKLFTDDDGNIKHKKYWCYVQILDATERTLCTGEAFGFGDSNVKFITKETNRGITCPYCRKLIKEFKKIKL